MDLLREMIRTAYQQKKWTDKEVRQVISALEWYPPQPGEPWLYDMLAEQLVDEGLSVDPDLSTKDSVYLVMLTGS